MLYLSSSRISSYLDKVALTKQSRLEYEKECSDIIDMIKKVMDLGYKTAGDAGIALSTLNLVKFKKNSLEYTSTANYKPTKLGELKTFLIHIGYDNSAASCILRCLKEPLTERGKEVLQKLK